MNKIRVVVLTVIIGALFFLFQNKEIISVPIVNAQTCTTPTQVTSVAITFPSCVGSVCNFTQGSCTWGAVANAANYNVVITQVETNTVISNQQIAAGTTSFVFSVAQSNTYKCDVSAVNSCGTMGTAGTASLLCKVDAAVSATPTATPAATIVPAVVVTPTPTITPVMPITGSEMPLMIFGVLSIALIIGGITAFKF